MQAILLVPVLWGQSQYSIGKNIFSCSCNPRSDLPIYDLVTLEPLYFPLVAMDLT